MYSVIYSVLYSLIFLSYMIFSLILSKADFSVYKYIYKLATYLMTAMCCIPC